MSPILCLSVLVMLFCTETGALKCYTCDGDDCTKVEECDDRNICMSSTSLHMVGTEPNITRAKFCTTANYCQEIDSIFNHHHVSININFVSIVASVKCCSTDLCNTDNPPDPPQYTLTPTGFQCKFCLSDEKTCRIQECMGVQTHCRRTIFNGRPQEGCATSNFCGEERYNRTEAFPGFAGSLQFPATCSLAKFIIFEPTTTEPTTAEPTTAEPTTAEPTTAEPTTAEPTTTEPTTAEPTMAEPTTAEPTTAEPTTAEPTTAEPKCVPIETTPEPTLPPCGRKG
ncbi:phospholipase A2 inhibitor subunit gamma B-like [Gouania willdenowi]|uniref:phospholipase A2 inhibitor subunit gamma B-like n=1 Tax=Gouania willdenowi TaxID=441366 RepID=UPI0010552BC2|nr:phospholipase A2 inhibitor subunit gamma B-like [Gouania willdenowi]